MGLTHNLATAQDCLPAPDLTRTGFETARNLDESFEVVFLEGGDGCWRVEHAGGPTSAEQAVHFYLAARFEPRFFEEKRGLPVRNKQTHETLRGTSMPHASRRSGDSR